MIFRAKLRALAAIVSAAVLLVLLSVGDTTFSSGIIPQAEARLGRPATPVSVAGAGRRTVRRCAAGVYNC